MKTTIFNKKAPAFFGAAAILLAAVFTIGCKTDVGNSNPAPEMFAVAFSVDGANGTLKATANGIAETDKSPIVVQKGKTVTFTAAADTYYKVDKWTITGGTFEAGTGTDGSTTAKVKITANTTVKVSFYKEYVKVALAGLDNHLKNTAPDTDGIYYIEVTGLTAADLKGEYTYPVKPSALGKILNDNLTKKVALKLSEVSGLTDMSRCFYECISLTQVPVIPSGVTDMSYCFYGCTSLTQAPMIPSGVTDMNQCFYDCKRLIQAPVIPSGVTNMMWCFYGCKRLTQAPVIPSSVTNMSYCFRYCESLIQAPAIPSGVTNMSNCFENCESLTQAPTIPSGVTNMSSCFENCESLTQAPTIPSGVTNMSSCFENCTSLTQAPVIPSSVTDMWSCFSGRKRLTQAPVIPSTVTNMRSCFFGCEKITAVTLKCDYNSEQIYSSPAFKDAFYGCKKLTANSIKVPAGQLSTYKANAATMGTTEDKFVARE
ncbi:MAG: leucine-rich repeat domain-containing protein [Treponema sp.]